MEIKIPQAPKIEQKETAPDRRKFAVVPIAAISDKRMTSFQFRVLVAVASYANKAGVCYVGQRKLAEDLKTHEPHVSAAMTKLKKLGHIESIAKPVTNVRGETVRVVFDQQISADEAVSVASAGSDEDLRPPEIKEIELAELRAMDDKVWTSEELKANKEKLAKLLIQAFSTKEDRPNMYTSLPTDTPAVKKIKQEIRSRMRQIRKEQFAEQYDEKKGIHDDVSKHKKMCSDTDECMSIDVSKQSDTDMCIREDVFKHDQMMYEDYVVYFQKELFNQVKTEEDLQVCAQLADSGVTRETLDTYVRQYPSDTVTQIGKRILGTGC